MIDSVKIASFSPCYDEPKGNLDPFNDGFCFDSRRIIKEFTINQIDKTINFIKKAGDENCDVALTCEDVANLSEYLILPKESNLFWQLVDKSSKIIEKEFLKLSKEKHIMIIGTYFRIDEYKNIKNTTSIFLDNGEILGFYDKVHIPPAEKYCVKAGEEFCVFDTKFGKIGVCICYDMMFPESVKCLSLLGAKLIFHPTLGLGFKEEIGIETLKVRSNDSGVFMIVSKNYNKSSCNGTSYYIDDGGNILCKGVSLPDSITITSIPLNSTKKFEEGFYNSFLYNERSVIEIMNEDRNTKAYGPITKEKDSKLKIIDRNKAYCAIKNKSCHW